MGRVPMNAMKKEDVNKIGKQHSSPMPAPTKKGQPKDYQKNKSGAVKNGSGWF